MKVLILGPVINENSSGGVAVFDEGLYGGFKELNDEVNILSIEKSSKIDNLIVDIKNPTPNKIFFNFGKIANMIKKYEPDLVISSLQYSAGIKKFKKKWGNAQYIQVLHGFPCPINGKFKSWSINKVAKYTKKYFDYVVTVSYLSYSINKKMNNIICDKVIHNGCALVPNKNLNERIYDFVYVGRLFKDKEVGMIADAFIKIKQNQPNLKVAIAGYGDMESLFKDGIYKDSGIDFLGKLTQIQVNDILSKSRFFVSMNPLEPFGIVFCEAAVNGCNIITQSSSGIVPLFFGKEYFHYSDSINSDELSKSLLRINDEYFEISEAEKVAIQKYMSFKRVATEYKQLIDKK